MNAASPDLAGGERASSLFAPRMLDPASGKLLSNVLITIRGERVISVTEGLAAPPAAGDPRAETAAAPPTVVLPSSWTVLPGLIDAHTHILLQPEDTVVAPVLHKSEACRAIEGVAAARRVLEAGFTALRDMDSEGAGYADVALRDAIHRGVVPGPRLFVSGMPLTITGGYMTQLGYSPEISLPDPGTPVDSAEAMIALVRRNVKYGVDLIKVYASGSLPQVTRDGLEPSVQFSADEIRRIVEEAARWHKDVAAHAYGGAPARNAILGGVRSIEHGILLDERDVELMAKHGVFYCPTMYVYHSEPGLEERNGALFMERIRARHRQAFQLAHKAGVKIAFGTDAGGFEHGLNAREFQLMAGCGMSPLETLRSTTVRAAELLRRERELGVVAPGAYADIIAVEGNPLEDLGAMTRVPFVMKGGAVFKHDRR